MKKNFLILFIIITSCFSSLCQNLIHINEYGDLLDTVQKSQLFNDQKMFVDLTPRYKQTPSQILKKYHKEKDNKDFNLQTFIADNFDTVFIDTSYVLNHIIVVR